MTEEFKTAYQKFIDTWGVAMQSVMAIEEMSELTKALCKYKRSLEILGDKEKALNNLKEEIADVLNVTEQLELIYGTDEIEKIRKEKIERTLKKAQGEKCKEKK